MSIENIYPNIMPYIDSYINLLDIMEFWKDAPNNCHEEGKLVLQVNPDGMIDLLEQLQYRNFLEYVIGHIQIDDTTKPIFLSESDEEIYPLMKHMINVDRSKTKIVLVKSKKQYEIETTNFMSQVLYTPLSQMHAYFVQTLEQFQEHKDALDPYKADLFLNAKEFSQLMNFIQEWCFEKLGLKKIQKNGICVSGTRDVEKVGQPW